jgi:hypothetical protein
MDARRRHFSLPAFALALVASLALAAPARAACAGAARRPVGAAIGTAKGATLCLLNAERTARGLSALASEPLLERIATSYSQSMVDARFFAHVAPGGQVLAQRLAAYTNGAGAFQIGENLAWGEGPLATPRSIVERWMHSDGHRANILNGEFREIGIGIVTGSPTGSLLTWSATYTTHFGTRQNVQSGGSALRAAASTDSAPPAAAAAKRVSAKTKRRIRRACHREVRKVRPRSKRVARYDRCVRRRMRAAARR